MPDHFLQTIRQLKHDLQRADDWHPHKFVECLDALIIRLAEAEAFLQTAAPSQAAVVLSHTIKTETADILRGSSLNLYRKGLLTSFFHRMPDPTLFSGTIQRLINKNNDPETLDLARETVRLGAIFFPESTKCGADILESEDQRLPVDICKGLLKNHLDYAWSYDQSRLSHAGARDFTIALLTVCADDGEEDFVIDFLERAHDTLLPDLSLNAEGRDTPTHAYYELILQHCRHEQLLVRLAELRPVFYQSLILDHHYQEGLHTKITDPKPGEVFDVSRLPPSCTMDEEFLSHALCRLSTSGKLNVARYEVIARTWEKAGFPGSVESYAKALEPVRKQLAELKAYRSTIFTESSLEQLWKGSKSLVTFHQSLLTLDYIYTTPAKQILKDVETLDRHHAMHVLKHDEIPETLKTNGIVVVSPLLLAACLKRVRVMSDYDQKNTDIEAVITDAFSNPSIGAGYSIHSAKRLGGAECASRLKAC